jgi:NH3-dependent NAD+ synthetase
VSATSIDTGKVIDVVVLTKCCQRCANAKDSEKLKEHQESHACNINFQGVSGGMEAAGAVAIFTRSVDMHGVRYTKCLWDGDSKGFMKVVEARPYGETEVEKLECIGNVQKRMGTHFASCEKNSRGQN